MPLPLPALAGTIDRRILINYRVDPAVLAPHVPPPFRLKTVHGHAIAGHATSQPSPTPPRP